MGARDRLQRLIYRPAKDYRRDMVNSHGSESEYRPSVEDLEKKYSHIVEQLDDEAATRRVKLVKRRGNKQVVRLLISTQKVRQLLNKSLPKIKRFSAENNGFTVVEFQSFMRIGNTAAQKYINLLLASDLIRHDGKRWAAKYVWNESAKERHL